MTPEREAMTLERQAFEKWVASKPDDWFDEASAEAIAWIAWQTRADLSRAAEPVGFVSKFDMDRMHYCQRNPDEYSSDVWVKPINVNDYVVPIYTHPPEPARDAELPREAPLGLLVSMAIRFDHGLGVPGYYDAPIFGVEGVGHAKRLRATISTMRQLYEEVSGHGFYSPAKEASYAAMAQESSDGD